MSVEIEITQTGAEEFAQALRRFDIAMQQQVSERLSEWAESVKATATRLAPVRTGYLRSTIYARTSDWKTEVGAEAPYAANIEFGTRNTQAKPFLAPAAQSQLPDLESLVLQGFDRAKTEAGL